MRNVIGCDPERIVRISPNDGYHYFFGYYDIPALTPDDRYHLTNRVRFMDRLPTPEDVNELGIIDVQTGSFYKFAESHAWNFQQGSLLQWRANSSNEVVYNTFENGAYHAVVYNVQTGMRRVYDYPIANVSPNGKYGVCVNMSRIYDFRPGYGYCNIKDSWASVNAPFDDGLRLLDLETGESKMLFSYRDLEDQLVSEPEFKDNKIVINHVNFNTTSDRFVFLLRNFPEKGEKWGTIIASSDLGGKLFQWSHYTVASHYHWKDDRTIVIYADCGEGLTIYETEDLNGKHKAYKKEYFPDDIHCSYSLDRRFIVGDGYPAADGYRDIYLYCFETDRIKSVCRVYSPFLSDMDIRCDNHCRWMHDGKSITFDGIHEGFRGIYKMDIGSDMDELAGRKRSVEDKYEQHI